MSPSTDLQATAHLLTASDSNGSADAWQRRFGVPWERVERAVRAVSDRAIAASRRKFASLEGASARSEAQPG